MKACLRKDDTSGWGFLLPQSLSKKSTQRFVHEAPGSRVVVDQAAKNGLQVLVHSLSLPIGLGVEARRQTDGGTNQTAKLLPEHRCELGFKTVDNREDGSVAFGCR